MLNYTINANNSQQISNIADENYRYVGDKLAAPPAEALKKQTQEYAYDANGNLISIQTGTKTTDQQLQVTKSRRLLWDEENRLSSACVFGTGK